MKITAIGQKKIIATFENNCYNVKLYNSNCKNYCNWQKMNNSNCENNCNQAKANNSNL